MTKESLAKVITGSKEERVYLCNRDFALFFCYYFVDYIKFPFAPFHFDFFQDIRDLMDGKYREVAWIAFRESAKTSIAKAFVLWLILYAKRKYINVDAYDKENAERTLFDVVVEMQTNQKIIADFGQVYNAKRDPNSATQKRVTNFVTNNKVRVEAHSTQESVRGRIHGHQRPDALLLDDFEVDRTKDSKALTAQIIGHIDEFKSGLDATAIVLYLGNYITENGSINSIKERAKTDTRLKYRQVDAEDSQGQPTWPSKYALTDEEASKTGKVSLEDKKRSLGSVVYAREMMNLPLADENAKFKRTMFRYIKMEEVEKMNTRKFATIDTALSKDAESDSTGVVRNYVNNQGFWHLDGRAYRINPKGLVDLIFKLHDEDMEKIGIETTVYTQAIEPFFHDECRKRNKYPYVVELKHGGVMKESRIEALVAPYEAKTIFHIEGRCEEMEEQLLKFPLGLHDDIIDAEQYQRFIAEAPFHIKEAFVESKPLYSDIGI